MKNISQTFLIYASDILGDTEHGLSGSQIAKYCLGYALEFSVDIPHPSYPFSSTVPNKRTALLENLRCFSSEQQYEIVEKLCELEFLKDNIAVMKLKEKLILEHGCLESYKSKTAENEIADNGDKTGEPLMQKHNEKISKSPKKKFSLFKGILIYVVLPLIIGIIIKYLPYEASIKTEGNNSLGIVKGDYNVDNSVSNNEINMIQKEDLFEVVEMMMKSQGVEKETSHKLVIDLIAQIPPHKIKELNKTLADAYKSYYAGQIAEAITGYGKALAIIEPYKKEKVMLLKYVLLTQRAVCYALLNEFDLAIEDNEQAILINSEEYKAYAGLGSVYKEQWEMTGEKHFFDLAIEQDQLAIEKGGDYLEIYLNMAKLYAVRGDFETALIILERSLNKEAINELLKADAYNMLGHIYINKEYFDKAEECFMKGLQYASSYNSSYFTELLNQSLNELKSRYEEYQFKD